MRTNSKFGEFIVWPENILIDSQEQKQKIKFLNATNLGRHFNISSQRLNLLLNELGWIEKTIAGWRLTKLGNTMGGDSLNTTHLGDLCVVAGNIFKKQRSLGNVSGNP